jgi:hypothetical protein
MKYDKVDPMLGNSERKTLKKKYIIFTIDGKGDDYTASRF